jgi:hypothetical protein
MIARLAAALLLLCGLGQAEATDIVLKGSIGGTDNQTYVEVPFTVPDGIGRLTVTFSYTGHEQHTVIDLGLFDPARFRGWSGGNKASFTLSATDATPSYLPGPIRAGTWKLILGVPNIRKDQHADYEARITLARAGEPFAVSAFSDAPLKPGPAWYRGDLHLHTAHSDGECTSQAGRKVPCPLYKSVEAAAARGLDFLAVSDHNSVSQFNAERELQPYFDRLLLLPGREITTFNGHANVFGPTEFIDFRLGSAAVPTFGKLLDQVEALHGLIAINHPRLPSGEICMGCGWSVADTDYARIPAIEIVNGGATALFGNADNPVSGIPFWEDLLNKGFRPTAIGGSDNHNGPAAQAPVGYPATVVYAENLSDRAILDGIRRGHVFIDVDGTTHRLLEFTARGGRVTMGDMLKVRAGEHVAFTLHVAGAPGATILIVEDGHKIAPLRDPLLAAADDHKTFSLAFDGKRHWLRAEVRDARNRLLLIGNPIYVNPAASASAVP